MAIDHILDCDVRSVLNGLAEIFNDLAKKKGWWDKPRSHGECIALMHTELSEAYEVMRVDFDMPSDKKIDCTAVEEELADCIIRIMEYSHYHKLDIGKAVIEKYEYNKTRKFKHGKKF